ncbi:MAG: LPXTG cell wall anchor domain-containing protein [Deltaproteobacteria bacterium]|nr:MAG: LPXTG cell wall anchor domain-containing protein [Deltaproteobacteria bacterium]
MDTAQWFVTLGGIALIALTLWFFFGKRKPAPPAAGEAADSYACPMHPWITSPVAGGSCSICGMALVRRDQP